MKSSVARQRPSGLPPSPDRGEPGPAIFIAQGSNTEAMSQPATPPFAPAPGPAPGQPIPPYPYYPPPPPKRTSTVLVVILIVVVLIVVVAIVLAAVLFIFVGGLISDGGGTPPILAFTPASLSDGNATFEVGGTSRSEPISSFTFRLEVGVVRSPPTTFAGSGVVRIVGVGGTTYQVSWNDTSGLGLLSTGDTIYVAGNGVVLGAGAYVFHLYWAPTGAEIASRSWTV